MRWPAIETLSLVQQDLSRTERRIATGLKVASPADDPSTFAIAQGVRGDNRGLPVDQQLAGSRQRPPSMSRFRARSRSPTR